MQVATDPRSDAWLRPLEQRWPRAVCQLLEHESAVARILIAEVRGSAPREPGACMLVTTRQCWGTIGGGRLEWQATQAARAFLQEGGTAHSVRVQRFNLGPDLGQCCGGVVRIWLELYTRMDVPFLSAAGQGTSATLAPCIATTLAGSGVSRQLLLPGSPELGVITERLRSLQPGARGAAAKDRVVLAARAAHEAVLLERLDPPTPQLWLYGAGHVGQALVRILAGLPFEITWIDERAALVPLALPGNVRAVVSESPLTTVGSAPPVTRYLVMTHDHALDYSICHEVLRQDTFHWLGLIGSQSKGARFRSRLARDGIAPSLVDRLVCPIGVSGIASKEPAAIAIAVAAQLLQGLSNARPASQAGACTVTDCQTCTSSQVNFV
jgi:xanthine dehydrogenase accessory factor